MYGTSAHRMRVPVDLDALLIDDTVSRQLSPTALRNQDAGVGDFGIAPRSPIDAYSHASPQTLALAFEAPAFAPPEESVAPLDDSPYGAVGAAIRVGR